MATFVMAVVTAAGGCGLGSQQDREIVLAGALGEGKDMVLYASFADGVFRHGFGRGPKYNRMPFGVDGTELKPAGEAVVGRVTVIIPSDGYNPPGGEPITAELALDADSYKGTVDGKAVAGKAVCTPIEPAGPDVPLRLVLACENTVASTSTKRRAQRIGVTLAAKDGKVFAARLHPPGSVVDVGYTAVAAEPKLTLVEGRLTGTLAGRIYPQGTPENVQRYVWRFDGLVIGEAAAGTIHITENGEAVRDGQFFATVRRGAPDPTDAILVLTLQGAVPPHNHMNLYLSLAGGKIAHGYGATPNFNNATHDLDLSGLRFDGSRLAGRLGVTVQPDPWVPRDHKPVPCSYELSVNLADGEAAGEFTGRFGATAAKGHIEGGLDARPSLEGLTAVTLKVEDGLFGAEPWQNRAFLSMTVVDGKVTGGRVWNNHTDLKGEVLGGTLGWADEKVRGTVTARVDPSGRIVTLRGYWVCQCGAGTQASD